MTHREERFVSAYLTAPNGAQAAVTAGYSPKGASVAAHRLLRRASVREAIAARKQEQLERANISAQWVLDKLVEITEDDVKPSDRLKALELIGKHVRIGAFAEKEKDTRTLVIIRDYTGREPKEREIDVTPLSELPVVEIESSS